MTSLKEIIGSLLRDTGGIDSTYFDSMFEWLNEAMRELQTSYTLELTMNKLEVCDYIAFLPCGFMEPVAVIYKNSRLRYGSNVLYQGGSKEVRLDKPDIYNPIGRIEPWLNDGVSFIYSLPQSTIEDYRINADKLIFSFKEGIVDFHYLKVPTDEEGFPMVPRQQSYKEAIKWYCIMKLIGAGYKHPIFTYELAYQMWEKYSPRAVHDTKLFTTDKAERLLHSQRRLIFPMHLWGDSFLKAEQPQEINTHGLQRY